MLIIARVRYSRHALHKDPDHHIIACFVYLLYCRSREDQIDNGNNEKNPSNYLMLMHARGICNADCTTLVVE